MLIVGDIHSCFNELLELSQLCPGEKIISVGDLFDRGKFGVEVSEFMRDNEPSLEFNAVMGNHELKLLNYLTGVRDWIPKHYLVFINKWAEKYELKSLVDLLQGLPVIIEFDDKLIVHGGVDLENPRNPSDINIYGGIRKPSKQKIFTGWWDDYDKFDGVPYVYYGHVSFPKPKQLKNSIGLDTAACHGGALTAIRVETGEIISIKSKKNYYGELKQWLPDNYALSEVAEFQRNELTKIPEYKHRNFRLRNL